MGDQVVVVGWSFNALLLGGMANDVTAEFNELFEFWVLVVMAKMDGCGTEQRF